jgi:hypothetical protein
VVEGSKGTVRLGVHVLRRTGHHQPGHLQHVFVPQSPRQVVLLGSRRGIKHHLHLPVTVAEVNEHQSAMVAPTVHPTADRDGLPNLGFAQFAAGVCPQQGIDPSKTAKGNFRERRTTAAGHGPLSVTTAAADRNGPSQSSRQTRQRGDGSIAPGRRDQAEWGRVPWGGGVGGAGTRVEPDGTERQVANRVAGSVSPRRNPLHNWPPPSRPTSGPGVKTRSPLPIQGRSKSDAEWSLRPETRE